MLLKTKTFRKKSILCDFERSCIRRSFTIRRTYSSWLILSALNSLMTVIYCWSRFAFSFRMTLNFCLHDIVLFQEPKQREVIQNSTRLSIGNNHKCAPWWAERTISMRSLLHNRQWLWVGDFLCLRKDQELHRRAAKMLFDKCCTCEGTGRGCALNGIKKICSDFETGLWWPFLEELHKHQSDWDSALIIVLWNNETFLHKISRNSPKNH